MTTSKNDFAGRSVAITGASSGIGAELARELVARGARVGLLARRAERLAALAEELDGGARPEGDPGAHPRVAWAEADVTDPAGLHAALDRLAAELGGIDTVVANAGIAAVEKPRKHEAGAAQRVYEVNLLGMLHLFDWAIPRFVEAGRGHLVGVASVASWLGIPGTAAYCGSKAAMRLHLQSLRLTLRRHGVVVTTICPGFVESEMTDGSGLPMPFLWPGDRAARVMADALAAGDRSGRGRELIFPWQMRGVVRLMRLLPRSWGEALLARSLKR